MGKPEDVVMMPDVRDKLKVALKSAREMIKESTADYDSVGAIFTILDVLDIIVARLP